MAGNCIKFGDKVDVDLMEFACDSIDEIQDLPTTSRFGKGIFEKYKIFAPIGSTCIVGNEGGDLLVYMLFGFGWKPLNK